MDFVLSLFGGPRSARPKDAAALAPARAPAVPLVTAAAATYDYAHLKASMSELQRRLDETKAKAAHFWQQAVAARSARDKYQQDVAKDFFRKYHQLGQRAVQTQRVLLTLDDQFEALQSQQVSALSVKALQLGNAELQRQLKELDIRTIERTQDELDKMLELVDEQAHELSAQPIGSDAGLEEEWEAFCAETVRHEQLAAGGESSDSESDSISERETATTAAPVQPRAETPPKYVSGLLAADDYQEVTLY